MTLRAITFLTCSGRENQLKIDIGIVKFWYGEYSFGQTKCEKPKPAPLHFKLILTAASCSKGIHKLQTTK